MEIAQGRFPAPARAVHGPLYDIVVALTISFILVVLVLALVAVRLATAPTSEDINRSPSASPQSPPTPPAGQ